MTLDEQILLLANGHHTPFMDMLMITLTGTFLWVPFYVAIFVFLVYKFGWIKALVMLAAIGCAITVADQVCSHLLRPMFERLRPSNPENPFSEYITVVNGYRGGKYGFPSCHASNCAALVGALAVFVKSARFTIFMTCWALLVCFTRLYLGVHYPSDIIFGALTGAAIGALFAMLCQYLAHRFKLYDKSKGCSPICFNIPYTESSQLCISPMMIPLLTMIFIILVCVIIYI